MEVNKNSYNDIPPKKSNSLTKSSNYPQKSNFCCINEDSQINSHNNNSNINLSFKSTIPSKNHLNKCENRLLFIQKININDEKNNYYKEGVDKIFNDENLFFSNLYRNKKVVVGRNKVNVVKSTNLMNSQEKTRYKNIIKNRFQKCIALKNYGKFKKNENIRSKKMFDKSTNYFDQSESNNYNNISTSFFFDGNKQDIGIKGSFFQGRRISFSCSGNNYISDGELKLLYQKYLDLEKENKKRELLKIKLNDKKNKRKSNEKQKYIKLFDNSKNKNSTEKEISLRLDLQEKILKKYKIDNQKNKNLLTKIKDYISKENNNKLLMNQIDNYRMKIEKIDDNQKLRQNNEKNGYYRQIHWLSNLRRYPKDKKDNNFEDSDNKLHKRKNRSLPIINEKKKNKREKILNNYINKINYSFASNNNNNSLYYDINSKINPLYALIFSDNNKDKEKIINTHIDDYFYYKPNIENKNKITKNKSISSLTSRHTDNPNNKNDLNIEGKRLIDYEIDLSKQLEGKRKKIIKIQNNDEEIEPKVFAKSNLIDNIFYSKAIKNTIDLHQNP